MLGAALISACADAPLVTTSDGGKTTTTWSRTELMDSPRCALRVCVLDEPAGGFKDGGRDEARRALQENVGSVRFGADEGRGRACDVALSFKSAAAPDSADVSSAFTGEALTRIDAPLAETGKLLCRLFAPETALGQRVAAWRADWVKSNSSVPASAR